MARRISRHLCEVTRDRRPSPISSTPRVLDASSAPRTRAAPALDRRSDAAGPRWPRQPRSA
eukprot:3226981-Pyramimonas_sp.AAC.1